jgi:hypothetical protein
MTDGAADNSRVDLSWVDETGRTFVAEFKRVRGEARWRDVQHWVQTVGPEVFQGLSVVQIMELRDNIMATLDYDPAADIPPDDVNEPSADELVAAVKTASPALAEYFKGWSRADIISALAVLVAVMNMLLTTGSAPQDVPEIKQIITEVTQVYERPAISPAPTSEPTNPPAPAAEPHNPPH